MEYKITHTTTYEYSESVGSCHNEARLKPMNSIHQQCLDSQIVIDPPANDYRERIDFFGNKVAYFAIQQPHNTLSVSAISTVKTLAEEKDIEAYNTMPWEDVAAGLSQNTDEQSLDAQQYKLNSPLIVANQELLDYAKRSFLDGRLIIDAVHDLTERIHRDFSYDPHFTTIATPLSEVLKHRRGVCQDFAHLAIGCIRTMGLAARYVSGYIETLPPEGEQKLIGADASHAWFSVYIPNMGWLDFDPTNNQIPMDKHITVAIGRDYHDVTPLKGVIFGGGKHELDVSVDVSKIETVS